MSLPGGASSRSKCCPKFPEWPASNCAAEVPIAWVNAYNGVTVVLEGVAKRAFESGHGGHSGVVSVAVALRRREDMIRIRFLSDHPTGHGVLSGLM